MIQGADIRDFLREQSDCSKRDLIGFKAVPCSFLQLALVIDKIIQGSLDGDF